MNKSPLIKAILLVTIFIFISVSPVRANDCTLAVESINQLIIKANFALDSNDFDQVSDIASDLKYNAQSILNAADSCDCDDAYYTAEVILENAQSAYLADDLKESVVFIHLLKKGANAAMTHAKSCGTLVTKVNN
ncbi:hypothetical protein [Colwellia psychrerythraea]|uniref:Lipoprotein n=1 Tax=Colwellia psychrerythraea TaxID=28229 RepID=A0A099KMB7_COLPS|nr:hypothetical protein [Colwellia psychrerythraea]KGJ91909.1 hypothetical protein GAB14E_3066 [Colwellia psychrerythraea]